MYTNTNRAYTSFNFFLIKKNTEIYILTVLSFNVYPVCV